MTLLLLCLVSMAVCLVVAELSNCLDAAQPDEDEDAKAPGRKAF